MAKYQCTKKCFHNLRLFRVGEIVTAKAEALPHDKEGKVIHFREIESEAVLDLDSPNPGEVEVKVNDKAHRVR